MESITQTEKALLEIERLGYDRKIAIDLASRTILDVRQAAESLFPLFEFCMAADRACKVIEALSASAAALGYSGECVIGMARTIASEFIQIENAIIDGSPSADRPVGLLRA